MAESQLGAAPLPAGSDVPQGSWAQVLDDLEHRVEAAESGDLMALEGWSPPAVQPRPMTVADQQRANGILARQQALTSRIRADQKVVAASIHAMRRPKYRAVTAPPVYVDRMG